MGDYCDFCGSDNGKEYLYKSQILKRVMKVRLCDKCAEKESESIRGKVSEVINDECKSVPGTSKKN